MTQMSREGLLEVVRRVWEVHDPVPEGLVGRMQAALAAADPVPEPMQLVEQPGPPGGSRATYTLRFVHGGTDLLLRVTVDATASRVDGWVVPPEPVTVRALGGDQPHTHGAVITGTGRFELAGLPAGPLRIRLEPHTAGAPTLTTPPFEI